MVPPMTRSKIEIRTITEAVFIATSAIARPRSLPAVNARDTTKFESLEARQAAANIAKLPGRCVRLDAGWQPFSKAASHATTRTSGFAFSPIGVAWAIPYGVVRPEWKIGKRTPVQPAQHTPAVSALKRDFVAMELIVARGKKPAASRRRHARR